ncbi:MAG: DMT family transporter [Alphaproteobacteria bacterium]|nr:DMT family transporter [Alphaproteobacteria bacterium]
MKRLSAGDLFLGLTVAIWGINFPISKALLAEFSPLAFAVCRYLPAGALLLLVLWWRDRSIAIERKDLGRLAAIGFVGITLFQIAWSNGLALTTAAKASILVSTTPAFGALWGLVRGRRQSAPALFGIALSFGGVFLLINNSLDRLTLGGGTLLGDLFMLAAGALWWFYTAWAVPVLERLGPLKVTAWAMSLGALALVPIAAPELAQQNFAAPGPIDWLGLAFTSIVSSAIGFLWWYEGTRRLGAQRAVLYTYLIPIAGVVASAAILGDVMTPVQLLGAGVVIAGVVLARR